MVAREVTPAVAAFLRQNIESLEELEVLLWVMDPPDRWWDVTALARSVGHDVSTARRALEHLASRNLLGIRVTNDIRYQFQPGTPALADACAACAEAYRTNPVAILRLIAELPRRSIRAFADAFRIRRDDDR